MIFVILSVGLAHGVAAACAYYLGLHKFAYGLVVWTVCASIVVVNLMGAK